jgi:Holliday junction resolvase
MEKCKLVHKLEQEQYPLASSDKYQVPDLFAVFDYEGKEILVLIEVKSSSKNRCYTANSDYLLAIQ